MQRNVEKMRLLFNELRNVEIIRLRDTSDDTSGKFYRLPPNKENTASPALFTAISSAILKSGIIFDIHICGNFSMILIPNGITKMVEKRPVPWRITESTNSYIMFKGLLI